MTRPKTIAGKARAGMRSLGVYKSEFDPIIEIYAQLVEQYNALTKIFEDSGYDYSESTVSGSKKDPIVTTLESLRKDILAYSSQLGLTPQGLLKANDKAFAVKKSNAISEALRMIKSG